MDSNVRNFVELLNRDGCNVFETLEEVAIDLLETTILSYACMFKAMSIMSAASDQSSVAANWNAVREVMNKYSSDTLSIAAWPTDFAAFATNQIGNNENADIGAAHNHSAGPTVPGQMANASHSEDTVYFEEAVLDETKLKKIPEGCRQVILGQNVLVTPLAARRSRQQNIELRRETKS